MCDLDNSYTNLFPTTAPFYLRNKKEGPWIIMIIQATMYNFDEVSF